MASETSVLAIELGADLKSKLDTLSRSLNRSAEAVAADAIAAYVDVSALQVAAIEQGIREADAGDFADDAEVDEFFRKWSA